MIGQKLRALVLKESGGIARPALSEEQMEAFLGRFAIMVYEAREAFGEVGINEASISESAYEYAKAVNAEPREKRMRG